MRKLNFLFVGVLSFVLCLFVSNSYSQTVAPSQTAGGLLQQESLTKKSLLLRDRIETERKTKEEMVPEEVTIDQNAPKVLISTIQVEGATLISQVDINSIISKYEGTELSLKGMQKVADLITDKYRESGYVTSRAYIPPQTVKGGLLLIRVVEGRLGTMEFKGNRYFATSLLEKKMNMPNSGYFDYSALQRAMVYINESPDRVAKATLIPGREPGTTDIIVNVVDNYPFHISYEYDNYGSRYIDNQRHAAVLEHNNLLGFDDKLYVKFQDSESLLLQLQQVRYLFPLTSSLDIGAYFLHTRTKLGEELKDIEAGGKATVVGLFASKKVIEKDDLNLNLNFGFDYKKIENELASVQSSRDELRVFKLGFDLDNIDKFGRNIFTAEIDAGVPDILNGMANKDPNCSRVGAGATFQKSVFNYYRLQPMPLSMSLLLKNSFQYTNHNLTASEQFQIGGATNVRGYPPAEHSGDKGFYSSVEVSFPLYGLSKYMKVPFRQERLYDALRLVCFYDIGFVNTKTLGVGETENNTLKGWGVGGRLNVSDDLSLRVEIGYPAGKTPSDGDHAHPWVEFILKF